MTSVRPTLGIIPTVRQKAQALWREVKPTIVPLLLLPIMPGAAAFGSSNLLNVVNEKTFRGRAITSEAAMGTVLVIKEESDINNFPSIDIAGEAEERGVPVEKIIKEKKDAVIAAFEKIRADFNRTDSDVSFALTWMLMKEDDEDCLMSQILKIIEEEKLDPVAAVKKLFESEKYQAMSKSDVPMAQKIYQDSYRSAIKMLAIIHNRMIDLDAELKRLGETNVILVVSNPAPSDSWVLRDYRVRGVVREKGTTGDHFSIDLRKCEKAGIIVRGISGHVRTGQIMIINGHTGEAVVSPSFSSLDAFIGYQRTTQRLKQQLLPLRSVEIATKDGVKINFAGNIESANDLPALREHGINTVGLVRTELFFIRDEDRIERRSEPGIEEQIIHYQEIIDKSEGGEVIFRTIDPDKDKQFPYFEKINGEAFGNGKKGLELCLDTSSPYHFAFRNQIKAFLRTTGKIKVMFPMVKSQAQYQAAMELVGKVREGLLAKEKVVNDQIEFGAMVENAELLGIGKGQRREGQSVKDRILEINAGKAPCPLKVLLKDGSLTFISIGSQDLTHSVTGIDRYEGSSSEYFDVLSPDVALAIELIIKSAKADGKSVSLCGDMGNDWMGLLVAVGLGLQNMSVSTFDSDLARKIGLTIYHEDLEEMIKGVKKCNTSEAVRSYIASFTREKMESGRWADLQEVETILFND